MPPKLQDMDVEPDSDGTYLVVCKNNKRLLYDGLVDKFSPYGKIATVCNKQNRNVQIRYTDKESALNCYYELCEDPDFKVDLPCKYHLEKKKQLQRSLETALNEESMIGFQRNVDKNGSTNERIPQPHYSCKRRRIIRSRAFKRFIISLCSIHKYSRINEKQEDYLESELEFQLRGVSLDFDIGFDKEIDDHPDCKELPQLVLAQDLYYFRTVKIIDSIDVLICNLPPWYQQIDVYKLVLPIVPDDVLNIDWFRMYPSGTEECNFPYAFIHLKSQRASQILRHSVDGLCIDNRVISIWLMDDIERMLVDTRRKAKLGNNYKHEKLLTLLLHADN